MELIPKTSPLPPATERMNRLSGTMAESQPVSQMHQDLEWVQPA